MKQWMKIGVFLGLLVGMVQMAVASEASVRSCAWADQSLAACVQQPAWNQQSGEVLVAVATVATRYDAESLFGRAVDFACRFIDEKGNIEGSMSSPMPMPMQLPAFWWQPTIVRAISDSDEPSSNSTCVMRHEARLSIWIQHPFWRNMHADSENEKQEMCVACSIRPL